MGGAGEGLGRGWGFGCKTLLLLGSAFLSGMVGGWGGTRGGGEGWTQRVCASLLKQQAWQ